MKSTVCSGNTRLDLYLLRLRRIKAVNKGLETCKRQVGTIIATSRPVNNADNGILTTVELEVVALADPGEELRVSGR